MNLINSNLKFPNGERWDNTNPHTIVVHHLEAEGSIWTVQFVHNMHIREQGWNGIGYHFYIRTDGTIYTGRPTHMIGAHCLGANTNTIGVCFEGDFMKKTYLPDAQYQAFCELKEYLEKQYNRTFQVKGHRELSSSECPGRYFPLDDIKNAQGGKYKANTWYQSDNGRWWYSTNSQGWYYKDQWAKIDNVWYCFDADGYVKENTWEKFEDKWCYLKQGGYAAMNEWYFIGGSWYYFDEHCYMVTKKWIKSATREVWYYLGEDGKMATGWIEDDGKRYYLNDQGEMQHDCVVDGITLNSDGSAKK